MRCILWLSRYFPFLQNFISGEKNILAGPTGHRQQIHWKRLGGNINILGISSNYHESAAALLVDGKIEAAIAQERLSRIKHDANFPKDAIDFCLQQAGITAEDLDWVVFYEKPLVKFHRNLINSLKYYPKSRSFFVDSMKNALVEKLWIKSTILSYLRQVRPSQILFVPHYQVDISFLESSRAGILL